MHKFTCADFSVLGKNLKTSVRDGLFDVVVVRFLLQLDSFSAGRAGVGIFGIRSSYFKYVWVWVSVLGCDFFCTIRIISLLS